MQRIMWRLKCRKQAPRNNTLEISYSGSQYHKTRDTEIEKETDSSGGSKGNKEVDRKGKRQRPLFLPKQKQLREGERLCEKKTKIGTAPKLPGYGRKMRTTSLRRRRRGRRRPMKQRQQQQRFFTILLARISGTSVWKLRHFHPPCRGFLPQRRRPMREPLNPGYHVRQDDGRRRRRKTAFWRSFENCIPKKKTSVAIDQIEGNPTQKKSVGSNWFHKRRNHSSSS